MIFKILKFKWSSLECYTYVESLHFCSSKISLWWFASNYTSSNQAFYGNDQDEEVKYAMSENDVDKTFRL